MLRRNEDWLATGIKILGKYGLNGLTIERMCEELGVTKGSFYHHFESMGDFEEQLIAYWADQYLSTQTGVPDDPQERLALLDRIMEELFSPITEPEVAVRMWAYQDERVSKYVEKVDVVRRNFALKVFRSFSGDEESTQLMADMLFTMLIGSITMLPRMSPARVQDLYLEFKRLYGLRAG
jgi:AcrR family transcriptional regulator